MLLKDVFTDKKNEINKNFSTSKYKFEKKAAIQCLLDFKSALDNANVPFWLCFGTLLGAVRDKDIIAGDTDIDICCRDKDEDALCQLLVKGIDGFEIVRLTSDLVSLSKYDLYIDVYVFRRTNQTQWMGDRDWQSYWYACSNCYYLLDWRFNPVIWMDFLGERFRILGDPVQYCTSRYHNWKKKSNEHAKF